jgi:hypothetical protein
MSDKSEITPISMSPLPTRSSGNGGRGGACLILFRILKPTSASRGPSPVVFLWEVAEVTKSEESSLDTAKPETGVTA